MQKEILTIKLEMLYELAEKYMSVMCGFDRPGRRAEKSQRSALKVRQMVFDGLEMDFLLGRFSSENVLPEGFSFGSQLMECAALAKIREESIQSGYLFMFHAPMPDLSAFPLSEIYLADSWQTCFVNAGRDVLRQLLLERTAEEYGRKFYITDTLAPGMFGIPVSAVKTFFQLLPAEEIALELLPSGMMQPVKSFVGIYLLLDREAVISSVNCAECLSHHTKCEYCKNYAERYK
ncbi:MAG: hypothetical protein ACI3ZR_07215 [bacterium]